MSCETVLTCGGCAARLRTRRPEASRSRGCPRCGAPLSAPAPPPAPPTAGDDRDEAHPPLPYDPAALRRDARIRGLREAGLLGTLTAVMAVTAFHAWRDAVEPVRVEAPAPEPPEARPASPRLASAGRPGPAARLARPLRFRTGPDLGAMPAIPETRPDDEPIGVERPAPEPSPPPSPVQQPNDPPSQPIRSAEPEAIAGHRLASGPGLPRTLLDPDDAAAMLAPALAPAATMPPAPIALPIEAPRLLVGDDSGRTLVSRLYARGPHGPVVLLPDGSLGWPEREVPTDRPFRPWTAHEVGRALRVGKFRGFRAVERHPYLVLYDGGEEFARDAAELLQGLYRDLTTCLEEGGLPVTEPEFPLVAIIHRDEDAFRKSRQVDPDVRAYYEITSNRIVLFESSEQDRRAPELADLRRPQTIAHEGVHQILQNVGVQPRLASWPSWLVEGLAEYYTPGSRPVADAEGHRRWGDYGRGNFGQVSSLHMATLIDLRDPAPPLAHLRGPGPRPTAPTWARLGPDEPWVTRLMLRTELSPTEYTLAWTLTHYLARRHPDAFRSYLLALGRRRPLEPRTPEQHLKDFAAAFGSHPAALVRPIDRHVASLRYDRVPFYAVRFEQATATGLPRRGVLVSPSPTMIAQWLRDQHLSDGGPFRWWAASFDSRNRARLACEAWLLYSVP